MEKTSSDRLQLIISYAIFVLSGFLTESPLHKSENIPLSLLCSVFASAITLLAIIALINKQKKTAKSHIFLNSSAAIIAAACSLSVTLMLLTEIIKDIAYIANRGVSLFYYTFIALIILFVSFYLCTSTANGVYRFTVISSLVFALLFTVMFLSLLSTRGVITAFLPEERGALSPALKGIKSGLYFTVDSTAFLICFENQSADSQQKVQKKDILTGLTLAIIFITVYNLFTVLIFGRLTSKISDPDYALIKLISGVDLTELISAVRITCFLIKSSVYISISAGYLKASFRGLRLSKIKLISIIYLLIPTIFLFLAFYDSSLGYGAFQHLIFPLTGLMSLCFLYLYLTTQKNNK